MQAYHVAGTGLRAQTACSPVLADGDVRVRVEAVCLESHDLQRCGSHAPGGGLVGEVVETGSAATAFAGTRVLVSPVQACGECPQCRRGMATVCQLRVVLGSERDGGLAEDVVASARWLTRLHDAVDIAGSVAAVAAGPALVAYGLYCRAGVAPGDAVVVAGRGPSMSILCALAKSRGAKLITVNDDEPYPEAELARLDLVGKPQHIFLCETKQPTTVLEHATPGSVVAIYRCQGALDLAELATRELCVVSMSHPQPDLMPELAAIVAKGELDLRAFAELKDVQAVQVAELETSAQAGKCLVVVHETR